ncbi:MAG: hypothetical protein RJB65_1225 [Actinomycetota bacterium]
MSGGSLLRRPTGGSGRTQWFALGGALVILAGVLVTWALSAASGRTDVVRMERDVRAGQTFVADDFAITGVAIDPGVEGLVPASALDDLVGRIAARDAAAGVLVQVGMWRDGTDLDSDEYSVGARLSPGHFPAGLAPGDLALAAELASGLDLLPSGGGESDGMGDPVVTGGSIPAAAPPSSTDEAIPVRVIDAVLTDDGYLDVTLAVPASSSVDVARWSANDQLVLVGLPVVTP